MSATYDRRWRCDVCESRTVIADINLEEEETTWPRGWYFIADAEGAETHVCGACWRRVSECIDLLRYERKAASA